MWCRSSGCCPCRCCARSWTALAACRRRTERCRHTQSPAPTAGVSAAAVLRDRCAPMQAAVHAGTARHARAACAMRQLPPPAQQSGADTERAWMGRAASSCPHPHTCRCPGCPRPPLCRPAGADMPLLVGACITTLPQTHTGRVSGTSVCAVLGIGEQQCRLLQDTLAAVSPADSSSGQQQQQQQQQQPADGFDLHELSLYLMAQIYGREAHRCAESASARAVAGCSGCWLHVALLCVCWRLCVGGCALAAAPPPTTMVCRQSHHHGVCPTTQHTTGLRRRTIGPSTAAPSAASWRHSRQQQRRPAAAAASQAGGSQVRACRSQVELAAS
jgi:hypothetical protein